MLRFITILFLLFATPVLAGEPIQQQWICHQTGLIGEQTTIALSRIFQGPSNDYESKEKAFAKIVSKQLGERFLPQFGARCEDYTTFERAAHYLKEKLRMFDEKGLKFYWVEFEFPSGQKAE